MCKSAVEVTDRPKDELTQLDHEAGVKHLAGFQKQQELGGAFLTGIWRCDNDFENLRIMFIEYIFVSCPYL